MANDFLTAEFHGKSAKLLIKLGKNCTKKMGATDQLGYNGFRTKGTTLQWRSSVLPKPVMCLSKLSRLANGCG